MNSLLHKLMLGGSTAVLATTIFALPATAQDAVETVTSSASRIQLEGYVAPTPVTVIGLEQISRDARVDLGDTLRSLPQLRSGGSSMNTGSNNNNAAQANAGANTLSLRNLGSNRNLVLLDGQRVVTSQIQDGSVDLSTLPDAVISRVEIVTGGASSAWGSDAVTGVINLIINKKFEGFKADLRFANSTEVTRRQYKGDVAWGTSFDGGRGHFMVAGTITRNDDAVFGGQRAHHNGRELVYNPAYCSQLSPVNGTANRTCATVNPGQPLMIHVDGVADFSRTQGGIITGYNLAGAVGATAPAAPTAQEIRDRIAAGQHPGGLIGTHFVGENATPTQFNYGTVFNNSRCYGACSNDQFSGHNPFFIEAIPYHSATLFTYASYQLTDSIKASIQLNYGTLRSKNTGSVRDAGETIRPDNAFLPQSIASQFGTLSNGYNTATQTGGTSATPTQSLSIGFTNINNRIAAGPASEDRNPLYTYENLCSGLGQPCNYMYRQLQRGVFTLEGSLGDNWTWNAYAQHSGIRIRQKTPNNPITARRNNATDAVRVTASNVGTSGLTVGSIQCRVVLQNPTSTDINIAGCQPVNIFGYGNVSQAAYKWINPGTDPRSGILNAESVYLNQDVFAGSMQGVLPWAMPAGEVSIAFGGEYRHEQARRRRTGGIGITFQAGNFPEYAGQYNVKEGFVELDIPILKDNFVQSLNLNTAGRLTDYSTSGLVETWKIGLQSQINDDLMVRGTWSLDIRAPLVDDLYSTGGFNNQNNCPNFNIGMAPATFTCQNISGGNPNLQPEKANTLSAGVVFRPSFLEGLSASLDWYQIHLHGGLQATGFDTVVSRCRLGEQGYCASISGLNTTTGLYTSVRTGKVNATLISTAGFDFQMDYGFAFWNGDLDLAFDATYVYDYSEIREGVRYQGAGQTEGRSNGGARIRGNLSANYKEGAWSWGIGTRFTGDAKRYGGTQGQPALALRAVSYSAAGTPTVSSGELQEGMVDSNYVPAVFPIDLRTSYRWNDNITIYFAIDNIQNLPTVDGTLRRNYRTGVRFNF